MAAKTENNMNRKAGARGKFQDGKKKKGIEEKEKRKKKKRGYKIRPRKKGERGERRESRTRNKKQRTETKCDMIRKNVVMLKIKKFSRQRNDKQRS